MAVNVTAGTLRSRAPIKRVLLVSTNTCPYNDYERRIMPTQLDYLASELAKREIEVTCLDLALEGAPFPIPVSTGSEAFHQGLYEQRKARLVKEVESGKYDLVALSFRNIDLGLIVPTETRRPFELHFLDQLDGFTKALNQIPDRPPLVAGGPAYSLYPGELLNRWGVDYGICGAGEAALPWLIEHINRGSPPQEKIIRKPFDFSTARFERGRIDLGTYFEWAVDASVQTKRGCDAVCNYCNYPAIEGSRYQLRPPGTVVDEMASLYTEFGFQSFYFLDSVFNWPSEHAKAIMREIIRRGMDIKYDAMINPRGIDEEFVDLAEESGLFKPITGAEREILRDPRIKPLLYLHEEAKEEGDAIQYSNGSSEFYGCTCPAFILEMIRSAGRMKVPLLMGIDSGDDTELKSLGKGFSVGDIRKAAGILKGRNIPFNYDLLFGGPGTTEQSIRNTMRLSIETGAEWVFIGLGIRVYPKTRLGRATRGSLWQKEEELLQTVVYPSALTPQQIMAIASEYNKEIKISFHLGCPTLFSLEL